MQLVLASASPRRRELLRLLGIPFEVVEPDVEELTEGDPLELVIRNAERKARAGAKLSGPEATILGSDTEVVVDDAVLGKPADAGEARQRIELLSGRTHLVHSGVWVQPPDAGRGVGDVETTAVTFRELGPAEIDSYVATGEWQGRAGGYAVQGLGSSMIAAVDGDLSNVIGLPLPLTARLIERLQDG